jgi:hypothetical protein
MPQRRSSLDNQGDSVMKNHILAVALSAFLLASTAIPGTAQQPKGSPIPQAEQQNPNEPPGMEGGMMDHGMMRHGGTMGHGMMGERGMMRRGMMGHRGTMDPVLMRIIFALMDSDGDGTVSLQEFQAAHEKIFRAMDVDKDGTVSFEEMMNFMRGMRGSVPHQ